MFIAGEVKGSEAVEPSKAKPNDRSTGPARARVLAATASLGGHARRFLLVSVAVLLAACSQLKLGYDNADTLLAYSLDSYLDLDDEQQRLANERIGALHRWHRATQLPGYVQLLDDAQRRVAGPLSAADVLAFNAGMRRALAAIGEQAAPDLAALALTLKPAQVVAFCQREEIDLVVVGPEDPLIAGLADDLHRAGIAVFGPGASRPRRARARTDAPTSARDRSRTPGCASERGRARRPRECSRNR